MIDTVTINKSEQKIQSQISRFYTLIEYLKEINIHIDIYNNMTLLEKIKNKFFKYHMSRSEIDNYIKRAEKYIFNIFDGIVWNTKFILELVYWMDDCDKDNSVKFKKPDGPFTMNYTNDDGISLNILTSNKDNTIYIMIVVVEDNISVYRVEDGVSRAAVTSLEMNKEQLEMIIPMKKIIIDLINKSFLYKK